MSSYQVTSSITNAKIKMLKAEALKSRHLNIKGHTRLAKTVEVKYLGQVNLGKRALLANLEDQKN